MGFVVEVGGLGARGAKVAVGGDAAGEQVVHQASSDLLILRNQRLRLFNFLIHRRKDFSDLALLIYRGKWNFELFKEPLWKSRQCRACLFRVDETAKQIRLKNVKGEPLIYLLRPAAD